MSTHIVSVVVTVKVTVAPCLAYRVPPAETVPVPPLNAALAVGAGFAACAGRARLVAMRAAIGMMVAPVRARCLRRRVGKNSWSDIRAPVGHAGAGFATAPCQAPVRRPNHSADQRSPRDDYFQ